MSYEFNCTNCGKTGYGSSGSGPMSGSNPPSGWITKWASSKIFCSNRCKDEFNKRNDADTNSSNTSFFSNSSDTSTDYTGEALKLQAEADKIRAENEESRILQEQQRKAKEKIETNIQNIASLNFGVTNNEITNVLDQLVIIGNSKPSPKERMAIYDKMEMGIMKLKLIGGVDVSFYELKMQKIKPTLFQKIIYFINNN
jgi:hypothetical protein